MLGIPTSYTFEILFFDSFGVDSYLPSSLHLSIIILHLGIGLKINIKGPECYKMGGQNGPKRGKPLRLTEDLSTF